MQPADISKETKDAIKTMGTRAIQDMAAMHREALHTQALSAEQRINHEAMLELYTYELRHRKHKR